MKDKVQVSKDVWIKPNNTDCVPEMGEEYWFVFSGGETVGDCWVGAPVDYAFWQVGNCFPTLQSAEAAIIKSVDPTPITYKQWVDAGSPGVYVIDSVGKLMSWPVRDYPVIFSACKCWLTRESAQAWLDKWNADQSKSANYEASGLTN